MTLTILPLGGCGEVGLNATLLVHEKQALLLDCGAFLGLDGAPGVNKVVPGFEPLFHDDRRLCGVVLTHGHEDHIGALPALLAERDAPVFGTPFTCALAASRLERDAIVPAEARAQRARLTEVPLGGRFRVGPFEIELYRVTHSVPQSAAVRIITPDGVLVHTGDFRLDPDPWDGRPTDLEGLSQGPVDVLMSDSTNAEVPGWGRSEKSVAQALEAEVRACRGRAVVTLMGSHVHRMAALAEVARRTDRKLCLLGRTLERNWNLGIEHGLLPADPHLLVVPERLAQRPRHGVLMLASGSQGEWNGGLHRIALGQDALLRLLPEDKVIFSARVIPGNEFAVRKLINQLARQGVSTVGPDQAPVHASGHARQDEQRALLERLKPEWFVPVYGERAMLEAHACTARETMPQTRVIVVENGQGLRLERGQLRLGDRETVSRRPLDGEGRVMDWGDVRERNRLSRGGLIACSVALDGAGRLKGPPVLTARGLRLDPKVEVDAKGAVARALADPHLIADDRREAVIRKALSPYFPRRGPRIEVLIVKID